MFGTRCMKTFLRCVIVTGCLTTVSILLYVTNVRFGVVKSIQRSEIVRYLKNDVFDWKCRSHRLSEDPSRYLYVTARFSGRLGNWMFVYASLIGISRKNNMNFYINRINPLNTAFPDTILHSKSFPVQCVEILPENKPCAFDAMLENLPRNNISIHGYLQSWRYFRDVQPEVRKRFRFESYILQSAYDKLQSYTSKFSNTDLIIGVHVRRQDMMLPSSLADGFKTAPLEYIFNAKEYFKNKFEAKSLKFVVVSDDFEWCSKYLKAEDTVVIPTGDKYRDLAILTLCNHSITTTGTFGWWGAYLAGGITTYYSNFPEPGSRLYRDTVKDDFYPPFWIPINEGNVCSHVHVVFYVLIVILAR